MLRENVPVEVVSKLLGHASLTTTIKTYARIFSDDALIKRVERRLLVSTLASLAMEVGGAGRRTPDSPALGPQPRASSPGLKDG